MRRPFSESLAANAALSGSDATEGLLAIEPVGDGRMRCYRRANAGVEFFEEEFRPFALVAETAFLEGAGLAYHIEPLEGEAPLRYLALFASWKEAESARRHLQKVTGKTPSAPDAPYLALTDPVHCHMLLTGRTLFKGMRFDEIRRMQVDIETATSPGFDFPNPERDGDRIIAIAMSDSTGWEEVLLDPKGSERALLQGFIDRVRERDPDVVEGHNCFRFDLPYIAARARRHRVPLTLGRGGERMTVRSSRATIGDRTMSYPKAEIHGRHVIDTFFLVLHYDVSARALAGFGLKEVARHFGVASDAREYVDPREITSLAVEDPERLRRYAADDVRETRAIGALLSPSWFVQAQMLPYSYQNVVVRGNATKIDALMLREYLRQRRSMPQPEPGRPFAGGYTDLFAVGLAENVWHCDVQSLYPSVMLRFGYGPERDQAGVFRGMLEDLRRFRLEAKSGLRSAKSERERNHLSALQATFKILINSFYGYLGFAQGRFNDFGAAEKVTAKGRAILRTMLGTLEREGAKIIEIDTDGIYFVPPEPGDDGTESDLSAALADALPEGIDVEFDGRFRAMFSYKMKNYALLDEDGRLSIKGAALKSRGIEPFQRQFMEEMLRLILEGRPSAVGELYESYLDKIEGRGWPIQMFAKTETLQDSPQTYREKIERSRRGRSAAYELALSSERPYRQGDQISYYITGTGKRAAAHANAKLVTDFDPDDRDENVAYYAEKLRSLYVKFEEFFSDKGCRLRSAKASDKTQRSRE